MYCQELPTFSLIVIAFETLGKPPHQLSFDIMKRKPYSVPVAKNIYQKYRHNSPKVKLNWCGGKLSSAKKAISFGSPREKFLPHE
jgi:hypothetical protein